MTLQTPTNVTGCIDPAGRVFVTQFSAKYLDSMKSKPKVWYSSVASVDTSMDPITEHIVDLSAIVGMRKWEGERKLMDLLFTTFKTEVEEYERTVRVKLRDFLAKKFTPYSTMAATLAKAGMVQPQKLVDYVFQNGTDATKVKTYDGLALFSASHQVNPKNAALSTFSNLHTGAGYAFSDAGLVAARDEFRLVPGCDGEPMGLEMTHVIVPPNKRDVADRLFNARQIRDVGSDANVEMEIANWADRGLTPIYPPNFPDDVWYGLAIDPSEQMPIHIQLPGGAARPLKVLGEESEHAKLHNEVLFMIDGQAVVFPAVPHRIKRFAPS